MYDYCTSIMLRYHRKLQATRNHDNGCSPHAAAARGELLVPRWGHYAHLRGAPDRTPDMKITSVVIAKGPFTNYVIPILGIWTPPRHPNFDEIYIFCYKK